MAGLILASGSPQRKAILEQLGIAFEVVVSGADEVMSGPPEEVVLENAYRKASAVASGPQATGDTNLQVLGVDTIVSLGSVIYGKPADASQAAETLRALSGRTHRVLSGICLIVAGRARTAAAVTSVTFRDLSPELVDWYVNTGEWQGRAGGYAIQGIGAALVAGIEGDYLNVVGLPVQAPIDLAPDTVFPGLFYLQ